MVGAVVVALSAFWAGLEPGPHGVGFEEMPLRDYSRPFRLEGTDKTRLLTLAIWYPARVAPDDVPVPFARYLGGEPADAARRIRAGGYRLEDEELERIVGEETMAFEGAPRAEGPFPIVLFGTGLTAPSYLNTVLCELLASYGYVVVAVPSLPYREDVSPDYDALTIESQLRDLELVVHELRDYPGVDIETIGLAAWGSGGIAQVLLAMKNPDVRAVASLDAASGYRYGYELIESSLYFDPARTGAPFFHASDSREDTSPAPKSFEYFDEIHRGPGYLLLLEGARHAEFTSLASVVPFGTDQAVRRRYLVLSAYVRRFFDRTLKNDPAAVEFFEVTPSRHGFVGAVLSKR